MAHFHIKKKKGRPYLYVREIARVNGKPKVISQTYIGSPEKVAGLVSAQAPDLQKLKVEEFGALWLANLIDQEIDRKRQLNRILFFTKRCRNLILGE